MKKYIIIISITLFSIVIITEFYYRISGAGKLISQGNYTLQNKRYLVIREWLKNNKYEFKPPNIRNHFPNENILPLYTIDTDGNGFIKPSTIHENPDVTIVFLGGSTTESMFVKPENRFPYRVGRILEKNLGVKINSLNAGKSGNNSMHSNLT